jgi:hexosaminidase
VNHKGEWSETYERRLEESVQILQDCDSIDAIITRMKSLAKRNRYTLEVYEQVNELVRFAPKALLALNAFDVAQSQEEQNVALREIRQLPGEFTKLRTQFERVYGKTRILTKPEDYILDQDHHAHLANQSISFDWQFYAEMLFLEKIQRDF